VLNAGADPDAVRSCRALTLGCWIKCRESVACSKQTCAVARGRTREQHQPWIRSDRGSRGNPFLIQQAVRHGEPGFIVGAGIFAATMVLLYLASTLYHALPIGRAKRVFRIIEHSAIFLLIAGTYTPFTLGVLRGAWGWTLLGLVWSIALAGVTLKALNRLTHPILTTSCICSWAGSL